ncbi:uncharacterized protein VTP21DRAFT_4782 [Calcarisporiella thermophila]|uniref:uncharacterized protein n=1 Tax=Calcarisporiella thermophila TaxID=911321 RepID=UPI003742949A
MLLPMNIKSALKLEDLGHETNCIILPNSKENITKIALDIGGSLVKLVYFTPLPNAKNGGHLNFIKFETHHIERCIDFIRNLIVEKTLNEKPFVKATGGGSYLYSSKFLKELGIEFERRDEMECLIRDGVYTHIQAEPKQFEVTHILGDLFPFMLVNIGTGVNVLKVSDHNKFERISGTSLGGGTLLGLNSLLTEANSFDELLELCERGDHRNVDMLVGDIYGKDYSKVGLKSTSIASSMGKIFRCGMTRDKKFKSEDISKSLLMMICNNIGEIAYLNAQIYNLKRVYFGGYFIRGHPIIMRTLSAAINFWSKGEIKAYYLRHEGYLGAVGALLGPNGQL